MRAAIMVSTALDVRALKETARGQWPRILSNLSINVPDNPKKHVPCPACGGEDRFRFDDRDGDGTYYCNQAAKQSGDGFDLIRHVRGCELKEAMQLVSDVIGGSSLVSHRPHMNGTKKMNGATLEKSVTIRHTPPEGHLGTTLFCYEAADGLAAFYVQRIERLDGKKVFPQWGPTEDGTGWQASMDHAVKPKPLYRLPAILANPEALIVIHEGEKAVEHHVAAGLPGISTTCSGGAGKAHLTDLSPLAGRHILICPDNDEPGEQHADDVAARAQAAGAASVKILRLPDLPIKGDVVEWLEAGGSPEAFTSLLEKSQEVRTSHAELEPIAALPIEPVSLDAPILPPLPTEAFPSWFRAMVEAVAEATETPVELAALQGLAVLSACCQRSFIIQVKPGYVEPLSLWMMTALESGNRKTTVMHTMAKPLMEYERRQAEAIKVDIERIQSERDLIQARLDALRAKGAKGTSEDFEDVKRQMKILEESLPDLPTIPQLWAQDITPEKVGQVMADNGERLALLSDEAGIFDIMGGRYSAGVANLDIFLQAHSGFFYRVDRGSRLPITMKHPALAIGLSPQPSVLRVLGENKAFRGRGLLARFLYALPMSTVGNRTFSGRPVAPHISAQYSDHIQTLLAIKPPQTEHNELGAYTLYLDDDAAAELHALSLQVEAWMKEGGHYEHVKDWAGKLPGAAARLAGVLHCATHAYGQPWTVKISLETMREVVGLAVVLGQHALAAFDLMGADIALEAARKVLRWIERKQKPLFSGRDCFQDLRGSFKTMNDLTTAIDILVERFYLFRQQAPSNGGRPPSPTFTVNPIVTKRWL